jgi:hypothetical protein
MVRIINCFTTIFPSAIRSADFKGYARISQPGNELPGYKAVVSVRLGF